MGLSSDDTRRREVVRDLAAGALLIGALFFPWNLYFGFRIPDSSKTVFGLLLAVTSLSLASLAVTFAGRRSQLRLGLNVPYLLLVLAFVVFDAIQTIRLGGTVHVPGGVGPGGWLGITGALLSAQPALTGATTDEGSHSRWLRATQFLGYASMLGAALSTGFNLSWRVRYALEPAAGASGFGKQNLAVIDTAVVYGVVALAAVLVASRWLLRPTAAEALSTVALGGSTLIAGSIVWSLPIGREIDAFHGIAQNTSTAGVGYEGYLVWAAAAAMCAPLTLFRSPNAPPIDKTVWRAASRNGLLLIAVWCLGSVAMRLTDLVVAVLLNYPFSRYDSMALAAFDLATAVLAIWLRFNMATEALPARLISSLCGLLCTFTVSRVSSASSWLRDSRHLRAGRLTPSTETILPSRSPAPSMWCCAAWRSASSRRPSSSAGCASCRNPRTPRRCPGLLDPPGFSGQLGRRTQCGRRSTGRRTTRRSSSGQRSGANANSRSPSPGSTAARNPSTRAARAGSATMWRTSPLR